MNREELRQEAPQKEKNKAQRTKRNQKTNGRGLRFAPADWSPAAKLLLCLLPFLLIAVIAFAVKYLKAESRYGQTNANGHTLSRMSFADAAEAESFDAKLREKVEESLAARRAQAPEAFTYPQDGALPVDTGGIERWYEGNAEFILTDEAGNTVHTLLIEAAEDGALTAVFDPAPKEEIPEGEAYQISSDLSGLSESGAEEAASESPAEAGKPEERRVSVGKGCYRTEAKTLIVYEDGELPLYYREPANELRIPEGESELQRQYAGLWIAKEQHAGSYLSQLQSADDLTE